MRATTILNKTLNELWYSGTGGCLELKLLWEPLPHLSVYSPIWHCSRYAFKKIVSVEKWSEHKSVWKAQNWFKREDCSFKYLRNIQHRQGKYSTRYCEPEYLPSNLSAHDLKTWRTELISLPIRLSLRQERYSLQTPSKPIKWVNLRIIDHIENRRILIFEYIVNIVNM